MQWKTQKYLILHDYAIKLSDMYSLLDLGTLPYLRLSFLWQELTPSSHCLVLISFDW